MHKVFVYYNSFDCVSCNLNLSDWNKFASKIDSASPYPVMFQFVFKPRRKNELKMILKRSDFNFPFYVDEKGEFEKLNKFHKDLPFRIFLLDENNQVQIIGNPINNPQIEKLYLKVIKEEDATTETANPITTVSIDRTSINMDKFDWQQEQTATFTLTNTGDKLLAIEMVDTSCGCITVNYKQEPVRPGGSVTLYVTYKADQPEYFSKTITVYCNAEEAPLRLTVSGNAK